MKTLLRRLFSRRRASNPQEPVVSPAPRGPAAPKFGARYRELVHSINAAPRPLRAVVVGANDGRLGDPLYPIIKGEAPDARVLLVEPHPHLMPHLQNNYAFLPGARFANCAVGSPGQTQLFSVLPDYWDRLAPPYAGADWPAYRGPLGVTSADRGFVEAWVARIGKGAVDPAQAVGPIEVVTRPLLDVVQETDMELPLDILQIDTEGFDDAVVYNAALDVTRPRLIALEVKHLDADKTARLIEYLAADYAVRRLGEHLLCARRDAPDLQAALDR